MWTPKKLTCAAAYLDDFTARSSDELSFTKGDRLELIERDDDFGDGWFLGRHLQNGSTGLFPEGMHRVVVLSFLGVLMDLYQCTRLRPRKAHLLQSRPSREASHHSTNRSP